MKKTLVALTVAALATSASAATIYEKDGTKFDLDASVRLLIQKDAKKVGDQKTTGHTNLTNNGSRLNIKLNQVIADDFYALGRVEFRFNGPEKDGSKKADEFGGFYADRAYVGLGSKEFGELTFGRQGTIGGDIPQAGFQNKYGDKFESLLEGSGRSVVRYDYKGIEGLQVGVDYRFAEDRNDSGEVVDGAPKSGYGVGAVYSFEGATVAAGYTRSNFVAPADALKKAHKDAWGFGAKYGVSGVTFGGDYAGSFEQKANGDKVRQNGFRLGVKFEVTPEVAVYSTYGHGVKVEKMANGRKTTKGDGLVFGSSYKLHKNVFTYAELAYTTSKVKGASTRDRNINAGVGLNVSF